MVFEQAPVTGLSLIVSAISTAIMRDSIAHARLLARNPLRHSSNKAVATTTLWGFVKRLPLEALPVGTLGVNMEDIILTACVLFQMRTLERRWGTRNFFSFILTASAVGISVMHWLVTESSLSTLSVDAVRVASAGASIVPLVAMATRYIREVPSISNYKFRIPITNISVTNKMYFVIPLMKLVLSPNGEVQASTHKRRAELIDIGVWTRIFLALVGILFGITSTQSRVLSWCLTIVNRLVACPLLSVLRPIYTALFGPATVIEHTSPKQTQQSSLQSSFSFSAHRPHAGDPADHGRLMVDSLSGRGSLGASQVRSRQRRSARSAEGGAGAPVVSPAAVLQLQELGLSASVQDITNALVAANGDVNRAAQMLI